MKTFLACTMILAVQALAMQSKPVVYLPANHAGILPIYGGKLLELIDAPATIFLPTHPDPAVEPEGWSIDVRNLGPNPVNVTDGDAFTIKISVGQTLQIVRGGRTYAVKW